MKKRIQMALALLLAVVLLCSALPVPEVYGESEEGEPRQLDKDLSREEDKSKKPQNEWTDVENTEYWNMLFAGVKRTGNWGEDLAHIAFTQIGYKESILNMRPDSFGMMRGYTRYGAWYGNSYGAWCAMFIAFCMHFAGIPDDAMPTQSDCEIWRRRRRERVLYAEARDKNYTPKPGDIIFFGYWWEPDHAGIVYSVDEEKNELKYIHGNVDMGDKRPRVAISTMKLHGGDVAGFAVMPENPDYHPYVEKLSDRLKMAIERALAPAENVAETAKTAETTEQAETAEATETTTEP